MIIRLAEETEVEKLTLISIAAFHSDTEVGGDANDGPPDYDSIPWHMQMQREKHLFTAIEENSIVGGAVVFLNTDSLYIGRIFISPIHFKKGYGYRLMKEIEVYFPNVKNIILDTPIWNIRTNNLYKKLGFIEISRDHECISYKKTQEILGNDIDLGLQIIEDSYRGIK